jgi:hypothetical protein
MTVSPLNATIEYFVEMFLPSNSMDMLLNEPNTSTSRAIKRLEEDLKQASYLPVQALQQ